VDRQLGDNAALQMLDGLFTAVRVNHAGRDCAAVQIDEATPSHEDDYENQDQDVAVAGGTPDVGLKRTDADRGKPRMRRHPPFAVVGHEAPAMALALPALPFAGLRPGESRRGAS